MERVAHEQEIVPTIRFTPPRTFVLVSVALLVMLTALLVGNFRDAPSATAQTNPSSYDLCDRTAAVRQAILVALQYPNRSYANTPGYGTLNASYPQATWGTVDTSNNNGVYTTDPCSTAGASLTIQATALASDANWTNGWRTAMRLVDKGLTRLVASDFAGLTNLQIVYLHGNSISEIPDGFFEDLDTITVASDRGNPGLVPSCKWFGSFARHVTEIAVSGSGISHSDIPPDAFDACFDSTQTQSNGHSTQLGRIKLRDQVNLGHVNLRWFSRLANFDGFEPNGSTIDTYFYADGPTGDLTTKRYTTGAETTEGYIDVTANDAAARKAMGEAIKAEIDRYWATLSRTPTTLPTTGGNSVLIGLTGSGRVGDWNTGFVLCDPWDRHPEGTKHIIAKFRDPDNNPSTPVPSAFSNLGCGASEISHMTKTQAFGAYHWDTWRRPFYPNTGRWDEFRPSEIKGLNVTGVKLTGSSITSLPDLIFQGSNVQHFDAKWQGRFEFDPKAWYGTSASVVRTLTVPNTRANHTDFATFDYFDDFTNLGNLDLRNTDLGYINTRWFERLANLNSLDLRGAWIAKYFYDADGNDPASTGSADHWDSSSMHAAIVAARTAYGTTQTLNIRGPSKIAIDFCDRPKVIWAEIMRNFKYLEGDAEAKTGAYVLNVGDVRHARYGAVEQGDCRPVRGKAVVKSSLASVDPETVTFDAAIHGRIIDDSGVTLRLRLNDSDGLGPTLDPDDFADFEKVKEIQLNNSGIAAIPGDTFAEAPDVEVLTLAGNSLDNADFTGTNFLRHFTKLGNLNLSGNLLTEFNSSWLPTAAKSSGANPLRTLNLNDNPLKSVDVDGLDLTSLRLNETNITSIDASILDQSNLASFWYQSPTLRLDGLHANGSAAFLTSLPATLADSQPSKFIGNHLRIEDDDLNASALQFQLDHHARMMAINAGDSGNDLVKVVALNDPCEGSSCLTEAQKNSFIDSLAGFNGLNWVNIYNGNLSSAQMARVFRSVDGQPMQRLNIEGNPSAFGSGFDSSTFSLLSGSDWQSLWQVRIVDSGLTFAQSQAILSNLADAFRPARSLDSDGNLRWTNRYLTHIDFSKNAELFTNATTTQLSSWLTGVSAIRPGWGPLNLAFSETKLDFDKLKAILDSIEQYDDAPDNAHGVRTLDVSGNPNLWNRWSTTDGEWQNVPQSEIEELMGRLQGLTNIDVSDTGLTVQELSGVMDALGSTNSATRNLGIKSALTRMQEFAVAGTDLGATTPSALETSFGDFGGRFDTAAPALRKLDLERTSINCADLIAIADGLDTADVLDSITELTLNGNSDLFDECPSTTTWTSCDPSSATDPVVTLFARFTNLRVINFDDTDATFNEMRCVVEGLDVADGAEDDVATKVRTYSVKDNTMAFTVPAADPGESMAAPAAEVASFFQQLPNARKVLTNTGLTTAQAVAALEEEQMGQSDEEQRETARRFSAQNPAFTFKTPLPDDFRLESGRGSLRGTFTHNPMHEGASFTVLRYEYRYRVRPENPSDPWASEVWRTASLDLNTTGTKQFEIYGLEPETIYQVQLRATSLASPAIDTASGGTSISLPQINKIVATVTEISIRAGDTVRLEVDLYGLANVLDNTLAKPGGQLVFDWKDNPAGGIFATPDDERRVVYTAPSLPGTYTVTAQAQPDGICRDHHDTDFDISAADRASCIATFTVRVSRAPTPTEAPVEPVNPSGPIPETLVDASGVNYRVFTPVEGGTFTGAGITVSAAKGAVPDRQMLGVSAAVSSVQAPEPVAGARMTIAGSLYEINGIQPGSQLPVLGFMLDDPLTACLPMPAEFSANISDVVLVERNVDGSYGILTTKLRQTGGELNVCGSFSALPATVGVAKLGVVEAPPPTPTPTIDTPETGATAPSNNLAVLALGIGIMLLLAALLYVLGGSLARAAPRERR